MRDGLWVEQVKGKGMRINKIKNNDTQFWKGNSVGS